MKPTILIDASALKRSHCGRKLHYTVVEGYRKAINSVDIEYGTAFHKFAEQLEHDPENIAKALKHAKDHLTNTPYVESPRKKHYNTQHLMATCLGFQEWRTSDSLQVLKDKAGVPLVECKFAYPYRSTPEVDILLSGTIDFIGQMKQGVYCIQDYKTTSSYDPKEYFSGYRNDPQLMMYYLQIKRLAHDYPDSVFADMIAKGVGCFIMGVFISSSKPTEYIRSELMMFKPDEIEEFEFMLASTVDLFLEWYPKLPPREGRINGTCVAKYGKCEYFDVCAAPDSRAGEFILNRNFIKKQYNPLTFGT
jgi:hypothetical protein